MVHSPNQLLSNLGQTWEMSWDTISSNMRVRGRDQCRRTIPYPKGNSWDIDDFWKTIFWMPNNEGIAF